MSQREVIDLYQYPKFRDTVRVIDEEGRIRLLDETAEEELLIESDGTEPFATVRQFVELLDGTRTQPELAAATGLTQDRVREYLTFLDRESLLTDSAYANMPFYTGLRFINELEYKVNQWMKQKLNSNPFWCKLIDGTLHQHAIFGHTIQNYIILRKEYDFDGPVMAFEQRP